MNRAGVFGWAAVVLLMVIFGLAVRGAAGTGQRALTVARAAWLEGDAARAQARARQALPGLRREVAALPTDLILRLELAEALALAGATAQAVSEAERAVALDPAPAGSRAGGAARGESPLERLAVVAIESGDTKRAEAALVRIAAQGGTLAEGSPLSDPRLARRLTGSEAQLVAAVHR